jgi:F-type H+-transporting ATPase subunit O
VLRYVPSLTSQGRKVLMVGFVKELDNKAIQRIEKAVSKSEFSQGKKLKVVTKVCPFPTPSF